MILEMSIQTSEADNAGVEKRDGSKHEEHGVQLCATFLSYDFVHEIWYRVIAFRLGMLLHLKRT
jgi:hypothetical protein